MIKKVQYFFLLVGIIALQQVKAQNLMPKDSVIQLFGVVMTSDSLRAVPAASVIVVGKGRGTITNNDGVFSIVVLRGDQITFSSIGFKDKEQATLLLELPLEDKPY